MDRKSLLEAADIIAGSLKDALSSGGMLDSNGWPANATDALFAIAEAIDRLARSTEQIATAITLKDLDLALRLSHDEVQVEEDQPKVVR